MNKIGAPPSLRAAEESLRKYRAYAASIKAFPTLLTADRNGTNCNPGEAVFLLYLLLWSDGRPSEQDLYSAQVLTQPSPTQPGGQRDRKGAGYAVGRVGTAPAAQWLIYKYSLRHNPGATVALFNQVAGNFGI
jgi:hypothetical protein